MQRQDVPSSRKYLVNNEIVKCRIIQLQKDNLLLSLSNFFEQKITKTELKTSLKTIKQDIEKTGCS